MAGSTPSNFRICFDKTLIELVRTAQKTSTLRRVKESKRWWETLDKALLHGNRLVRAQSNRAYNSIFGWLRIDFISESGTVTSFLNPISKKELGCDGWSDDEYITKWCDGERDTIVKRIYFTFIPYTAIPDYQYTKLDVKAAIDACAARTNTRLRGRNDFVHVNMQMSEEPGSISVDGPATHLGSAPEVEDLVRRLDKSVSVLQSSVLNRNDISQLRQDDRVKDDQIISLQRRVIEQESRALDAQRLTLETQQKAFERDQAALVNQHKAFKREQTMLQESLLRERTESKAALMREQQLNDNNRTNAQAKENLQLFLAVEASRQKFFMEMMQNTNFSALLSNSVLQPGLLAMMQPSSATVARVAPAAISSSSSSVGVAPNLALDFKEESA